MSARIPRRGFLAGAGLAAAAGLAGCLIDPANPANRKPGQIRIGSAMSPESEIIARIWALALADAGRDVHVIPQIGSREVYLAALAEGAIDLVPEYSGNLLAHYGEVPAGADEDDILGALRAALPAGFITLDAAPAESKDAYRVTRATAEELDLTSLADLAAAAEAAGPLKIGAPPELAERPYGPDGLSGVYGVAPGGVELVGYGDSGGPLTLRALLDGAIDLANIYTTSPIPGPDGRPADLVTLADPERLIPPQNVLPVARAAAVDGAARELLAGVNARLTTEDLVAMNQRSSGVEKAGADRIARDWLDGAAPGTGLG
ncbi:ABC transporter substrate-binding protein [Corynebacterium sphenisci]|uniref:ABC transporter substrate-binding protein n=1 Tax=Corynebacterium sphenisci TaxID=191493 RepID=UPI0026E0F5CC|nr:ABC transporter substrate-binding protein [Corynebacterium sphenisci]MDO5731580.1 ABC transporter substrate-binding protein [Corynebacterium sphenisci]